MNPSTDAPTRSPSRPPLPWMPPATAPTRWEALGHVVRTYTPNSDDARRLYDAIERACSTLHPLPL